MKDTPEGQTHWPTCWKDHHECAKARLDSILKYVDTKGFFSAHEGIPRQIRAFVYGLEAFEDCE